VTLTYDEVIDCKGIAIPFIPAILTPRIERSVRKANYEGGERKALQKILRPGDRLLELGGGLGLLSALAAKIEGIGSVTVVEANPDLIPVIRETHRLNGATSVEVRNAVVTAEDGPPVPFFLRSDFWASSMEPASRPFSSVVELPRAPLAALVAEVRPTVIVCDIEGGESGLFDHVDLGTVRALIVEFHPKVYGPDHLKRIAGLLNAKGLEMAARIEETGTVHLFTRPETPTRSPLSMLPPRSTRDWPITAPRVQIVTCMKDEGPFILEWLAWHKSIGVTDLTVFTNHCSDGTDRLLDRLQDMGHLSHLPNPAVATGETHFQPIALNYAHHLRQTREADFFISMDVDEFINVRTGDGTLAALFDATGCFDVLSITEVNHGSNRLEHFEPGWLVEQFPLHQSIRSGVRRSRRGVKSIVRLSEKVERLRNHRPDMIDLTGPVIWLDGSGRDQHSLAEDRGENGLDSRGTYGLVRLEHFALRSLDSYLAKMNRGDVVIDGKQVSQTYWRMRNRNEEASGDYGNTLKRARSWYETHLASDPALMALHQGCCRAHQARIDDITKVPAYIERRNWVLSSAW